MYESVAGDEQVDTLLVLLGARREPGSTPVLLVRIGSTPVVTLLAFTFVSSNSAKSSIAMLLGGRLHAPLGRRGEP